MLGSWPGAAAKEMDHPHGQNNSHVPIDLSMRMSCKYGRILSGVSSTQVRGGGGVSSMEAATVEVDELDAEEKECRKVLALKDLICTLRIGGNARLDTREKCRMNMEAR
jgi:hypothetical protein